MTGNIFFIVWVAWIIALLVLYHKAFEVYYFSVGNGLLKELITAAFLGLIMTSVTFYLWWLTAIIVILAGLIIMGKVNNRAPLIISIVLAVIIAILGINFRSSTEESNISASTINHQMNAENMA